MNQRSSASSTPLWNDADDALARRRYETVLETVADGIYQLDTTGRIVAVNDVIVETTGYAREELLGEPATVLFAGEDSEWVANRDGTAEGDTTIFDLTLETADGETIPVTVRTRRSIVDGTVEGTIGVVRDLGDRRRAAAEPTPEATTNELLQTVIEDVDSGVFVLDDQYRIAMADETVGQFFGVDPEAIRGRDKRTVLEEQLVDVVEDPEAFAERVLATYEDGHGDQRFECHVRGGEDRADRWLEHRSHPIDSGQYAGGRIELYTEITDRKSSTAALEESQERFHSLADAVEEYAIFRLDSTGHVASWNEGAREIKGYEPEEILGEHFSAFYTEEDRAGGIPERNLEQAKADGSVEDEGWRVRKDGSQFWANVTITTLRHDDGTHRGFLKVTRDMTDRHRHEQELETELRRILDRISDAFFALDEDFRFTLVNGRAEELLGRPREELIGQGVETVLEKDTAIRERLEEAMVTQEPETFETEQDSLGGWIEVTAYPSETGLSVYFQDVTERKEREHELERALDLLDRTERIADVGGWEIDTREMDVFWSDNLFELLEIDGEQEPPLEEALDLYHPEDRQAVETAIEDAIDGQESFDVEARIQRGSGEIRWVRVQGVPETEGSTVVSIRGAIQDITERKASERRIEESERRYRTLVENFPNGAVGLFDEDLEYTAVGGEMLDDMGVDAADRIGESVPETYPEPIVEEVKPYFQGALEGESNAFEIEYQGRHVSAHTLPIRDADGEVFAGMLVVQDVTERERHKRELEESNERLEQFAYAASHDLQEPLRMVSSYLQLIENRYGEELDEDGREFLAFAVDGADRMRDMIDGLLKYSRIESQGDPLEPVDLNDVLADVRENLHVMVREHDAEIAAEELPRVDGDAGQLRQLFQNLLKNAVEYSGEEPPRIDVTATPIPGGPTPERPADPDAVERWELSVADDGVGIDAEDTERIFDVFQRLGDGQGSGIGLALCKRIVERHGGDIWVESTPGKGSTFSFTLAPAGAAGNESEDGVEGGTVDGMEVEMEEIEEETVDGMEEETGGDTDE